MDSKHLCAINKKLDVVIALLLQLKPRDLEGLSLRDQIRTLDDLEVRPREMASILGRSNVYVNKELSQLRKAKK